MIIRKTARFLVAFLLIFSWFITGWPRIYNFPPQIQEVHAAVAKVSAQPAGVSHSTASTSCANVATTNFGVAGDTFVIEVALPVGGTVTGVTDNATGGSNTYSKVVIENASGGHSELWYVLNAPRGNTSSLVITAAFSSQKNSCVFAEYSGVSAIGTTNTNTGGAAALVTATTVTSSANSWMIAGMADAPSTATWGTPTVGNLRTSVAGASTTTPGAAIVDNTNAAQGNSLVTSTTLSVSTKTWAVSVLELRSDIKLPTMSPNGGSFNNDTVTTFSDTDSGVTFCSTLDGSSPAASTPGACSAGTSGTSATAVATGTNVKVLATKAGWVNSGIVTSGSTFTLTVANPSFGTNGGSFNNDTSTSFSSTTTGAVFCSTLNGSTPAAATPGTCSAGATGASVTVIATGTTVQVLGTKANYVNSAVQTSSAFTLTVGAVTSSPGAGTYTGTQSVTLNIATTTGATAHYTTDGSAVTCSSTTYPGAFNVSTTTTVKAIACKTSYVSDTAISDLYTINIISISITSNGTVAYGILTSGQTKSTINLSDTQTAKNDGNVAEDFNIETSAPAGWSLGSSSSSDTFVHEFSINSGSAWTKFTTANSYQSFVSNIAAAGTQNFDLRFTAPNPSTSTTQKTITITIQAVAH